MNEIEKNPKFNGLRVRTVSDAGDAPLVESHPAHPNREAPDEIAPNPEHGGLRVREVSPKGTPLVESHPQHPDRIAERNERNMKHPEHDSLAALGSRERK